MDRFNITIGPVTINVHLFLSEINLCENCAFVLFYLLCFTKKPLLHSQKSASANHCCICMQRSFYYHKNIFHITQLHKKEVLVYVFQINMEIYRYLYENFCYICNKIYFCKVQCNLHHR